MCIKDRSPVSFNLVETSCFRRKFCSVFKKKLYGLETIGVKNVLPLEAKQKIAHLPAPLPPPLLPEVTGGSPGRPGHAGGGGGQVKEMVTSMLLPPRSATPLSCPQPETFILICLYGVYRYPHQPVIYPTFFLIC